MLKFLNISNFAVIQNLEINFGSGLNLLTGETGSGKSIIVDALSLLMGSRGSSSIIRTGERLAYIEALFSFGSEEEHEVRSLLAENGIEGQAQGEILIRRELYSNGRSRIFIDDQNSTAGLLRALQPLLVEIHGQGEQRALLSTQSHRDLLDSFAGCLALRERVRESYIIWKTAVEGVQMLEVERNEHERSGHLLQHQLAEIESLRPKSGEDEELSAEKVMLTHTEKLTQLSAGVYVELYEKDESVLTRLASVRRQLEELSRIDTRLRQALETVCASEASLIDVAEAVRSYASGVEFSPGRLDAIENRLAELERLKRKYSTDLQGIIEIEAQFRRKLSAVEDFNERISQARRELSAARKEYAAQSAQLTACRVKSAAKLAKRVINDLKHLAMDQAQFLVSIKTATLENDLKTESDESVEAQDHSESNAFFSPAGADRVEFLFSANPGESMRSLSQTASGGELSRLMLTLRTVCREEEARRRGTVIFDEIDAGIGGRVSEAVGLRLKALSASRQVLCVTHQPQIARFADQHFVVAKSFEEGRTTTHVKLLDAEERVKELSRMIGGTEESQKTLEAARWMLTEASFAKTPTAGQRKRKGSEMK
ncbi:MAG: DNA repair protein RecN [Pyrinomonadaceae bacterium]